MFSKARALDRRQRLGHAVDEGLDADKAGLRPRLRLRHQGFAAAETDLEGDFRDRNWKKAA